MAETQRCPQCDSVLPADAPEGLCPMCLLRDGVQSTLAADAPEGWTVSGPRFVPPEPEEIAEQFPQLEVIELLGVGGMGVVYKARQPGLDRLVALKILPPEVGADPTFAQRFSREARSLARLNHPNIVNVYDFGLVGGYFYFIMEYVDGVNLRQMERAEQLSPEQALAIVPQICEALQYAHDEGIVHRDIKPENILIDRKGRVKIADFGLAKLLARGVMDYTLTQPQQLMGTIHYMAPEQLERPGEVDHRADIYSLGVVFYEMLTGELPLGRFAPPSRKVELDVRLDEVVLKTLEKEPDLRYQRASQVKGDVDSIASGLAPGPVATAPAEAALGPVGPELRAPANALLAAGLIAVSSVVPGFGLLAFEREIFWEISNEGMLTLIVMQVLVVPVAALTILSAAGLKRRQFYGLAVTCCILMMVPFTPGWLLSLPLGIWALLALRRPEARAAFARGPSALASTAPGRPPSLPGADAAARWEQPQAPQVGAAAAGPDARWPQPPPAPVPPMQQAGPPMAARGPVAEEKPDPDRGRWLGRTRVGAILVALGLLGFLGCDLLLRLFVHAAIPVLGMVGIQLVWLLPGVVWVVGIWLFTAGPPRHLAPGPAPAARAVARWGALLVILIFVPNLFAYRAFPPHVAVLVVGILSALVWSVPHFAVFYYARHLFAHLYRPNLARQAAFLTWAFPLIKAAPTVATTLVTFVGFVGVGRIDLPPDSWVGLLTMGLLTLPVAAVLIWAIIVLAFYGLAKHAGLAPSAAGPAPVPGKDVETHPDIEAARRQVQGPATGLLVVGLLNCLPIVLGCLAIPLTFFWAVDREPGPPRYPPPVERHGTGGLPRRQTAPVGQWGETGPAALSGPAGIRGRVTTASLPVAQAGAPSRAHASAMGSLELLVIVFALPATIFILIGSVKMRRLQSYGLAITASILAMLPCTPFVLIGLPMGIWALVVLAKPEVKAGFALRAALGATVRPE